MASYAITERNRNLTAKRTLRAFEKLCTRIVQAKRAGNLELLEKLRQEKARRFPQYGMGVA
jgi:hypothetical protein